VSPHLPPKLLDPVATLGGDVLGALSAGVARIRPAKPLHPTGVVVGAHLHRYGTKKVFGIPWVDEPGRHDAVVRFSRALGLPERLPDVLGIALRVLTDEGIADLLFATTGHHRLGRFLLMPRRADGEVYAPHPYTTLLPYRSDVGPVLFGAEPTRDGRGVQLSVAHAFGEWHPFGLVMSEQEPQGAHDELISFDPVLNPPPGLSPYPWVSRLRESAYSAARGARR